MDGGDRLVGHQRASMVALGTQLDAIYDFHAQHGIKPQRGHGMHNADGAVIRWCFADASLAAVFATKFKT
jgi:hypothetical protein